jgi:acid phosphatase family membrane protein YuiD
MQILKDILHNHLFIVPIIAWAVSQIIKTVTIIVRDKKLSLRAMVKDGGMPSAHSATVIALAVMSGWTQGFGSAAFAISMILAVVIMRDAVGVRRESGVNASIIKLLAKRSNSQLKDGEEHIKTDMLKELVGHTPLQVACGCIIGIIVCIIYIWIGGIPMA